MDTVDIRKAVDSQFLAALTMLEQTIQRCPPDLWVDPQAKDQFWQIAYHALFYTHLYLQESEATFRPWAKYRKDYHFLGPIPWEGNRMPEIGEPYTHAEVLDYLAFCRSEGLARLPKMDFAAPSGFEWLPFNKLELQFYIIRHLQQHTGELGTRLSGRGIEIGWVGALPA
jgi:hypothetical protein